MWRANSISRYRVICSVQTRGSNNLKNYLEKRRKQSNYYKWKYKSNTIRRKTQQCSEWSANGGARQASLALIKDFPLAGLV